MLRNKITAYVLLLTLLFIQVASVLHVSHHAALDAYSLHKLTPSEQVFRFAASSEQASFSSQSSTLSFNWLDSHCEDCFQLGQWNSALPFIWSLFFLSDQGWPSLAVRNLGLVSTYSFLSSPARAPPYLTLPV